VAVWHPGIVSHHDTILAHLVDWACSNRHEDAATEGLAYVLDRHPAVRQRFVELLRTIESRLPVDLRFTTQHSVGEGRADMAGRSGGALRVLVENKFGAALTGNQPNGYLAALRETPGATLLLFIAPGPRKEWLWQELIGRVKEQAPVPAVEHVVEFVGAQGTVRLALIDWPTLFTRLRDGLTEPAATTDLTQLVGLCRAVDERAWRPFEAEELSDQRVPQRMAHYLEVVRDSLARATPDVLSQPNRSDHHGWGWCGYKFQFTGANAPGAWLGFSLWRWRENGISPIWLHFERKYHDLLEMRLRGWCEQTGRVFRIIEDGIMIPIKLLLQRDQSAVVNDMVEQLREIRALLIPTIAG
jgi:hypothetical protein